jgi:PAS domain S-box-containing protein
MAFTPRSPEFQKTMPWKLVVIFLVFSVGIILVGGIYYVSQRNRIFKEQEKTLEAVASLKIGQIIQWHKERLGDAENIMSNKPLIRSIIQYLKDEKQPEIKSDLLSWMKSFDSSNGYGDVLLVDTALKVRLSVSSGDTLVSKFAREQMVNVLKNHKVLMTELHKSDFLVYINSDILIPLMDPDSNKPIIVGIAILRIDPGKILFPLIQSWPTTSKSSETLIVQRSGDSVLYLNSLRHLQNTSLSLKAPLSNEDLLASKAINGVEGFVEGIDYRNVQVIGFIVPIPDFFWYMIAKIDKEELKAPLRRYFTIVILVAVMLILITASVFGFWIWEQRVRLYQNQLKNELDREALERHFEYIFKYANDIITLLDKDMKVVVANDSALRAYGYSKEEMIGMEEKLLGAKAQQFQISDHKKSLDETGSAIYETVNVRKDGHEFPVDVSARAIEIEGIKYFQFIARDISERKKNETATKESEALFFAAFKSSPLSMTIASAQDGKFLNVNDIFLRDSGYNRDEVIGQRAADLGMFYDQEERTHHLEELKNNGFVYGMECRFVMKDGKVRKCLISTSEVTIGGLPYHLSAALDVSANDEAQKMIREQFFTLKGIIESSAGPIFSLDTNYCYTCFNKVHASTMKLLYGVDIELGKNMLDYQSNIADRSKAKANIDKALSGEFVEESAWSGEESETRRFFEVIHNPIFNDNGEVVGVAISARDQTERKKMEESLLETKNILQSAFDISQAGIAIADAPDGKLRYVNDAGLLIRGGDRKSAVEGIGIDQYVGSWKLFDIDGSPLESDEVPLTRALKYGVTNSREFIIRRNTGDDRIVMANAAPIKDEKGKIIAGIVIFLDITELKNAEEKTLEKARELERFNNLMVGRELRMVELKNEINNLLKEMGKDKRYKIAGNEDPENV